MSTTFSGPVISEGGFIGGGMMSGIPSGETFYVNTNTSTSRNKDRPWFDVDEDRVFSTYQGAIDACVDDRGDIIHVARAYTAVTTPVLFNKAGITVLLANYGLPPMYGGEYCAIDNTTGGAPAAIISKHCHIRGLGFHTAWTGGISSNVLVEVVSGEAGWVWFNSCRVMNWGTATVYGMNFEAGANCVVDCCSLEGNAAQGFVNAAIAFGGSPTQNPIRNVVQGSNFSNCTYAIEHKDGTPQEFKYGPFNTTIPATVATKFLNTKAAAATGIVCKNQFYTAVGNGTYSDADAATVEALGIILVGNDYATEDPGPT